MTSPYMNTREAAIYLRFVDAEGRPALVRLMDFLRRYKVPIVKRGKSVLIHKDEIEAVLERRVSA